MPKEIRKKIHHEAPLIQGFKNVMEKDQFFGIKREINIGNDSPNCSDVEYISHGNEYLIIEAKSHESKDSYNTRHKIFGQLLKEHGKINSNRLDHSSKIALGILIPKDKPSTGKSNTKKSGCDFYRHGFRDIPSELFTAFGRLVKAKYIFACSLAESEVDVYTWEGFQSGDAPIHNVKIKT
jgi:hypothetical protein